MHGPIAGRESSINGESGREAVSSQLTGSGSEEKTAGEYGANEWLVDEMYEKYLADPDSVFHHYRRLIELRHTVPAIVHGDFTMLLEEDERIYAFTRRHEDTELLVLGNFSADEVTVDLTGWEDAELLIGEHRGALQPWESRVYCR